MAQKEVQVLCSRRNPLDLPRQEKQPDMEPQPQTCRILFLPYEIRMQIWRHAIPSKTDLRFCPCLIHPPRSSEKETCLCRQESALASLATHRPPPSNLHLSLSMRPSPTANEPEQPPVFLLSHGELFSSLPLACRQIHADTISIPQPRKHLTLCSSECLTSLLSTLTPQQLTSIAKITLAIDLRIFRPVPSTGQLASFHDIWKSIYNARIAADRCTRKFFATPAVDRMNADIIEPELDFYPLEINCGRPFDRQEMANRSYWSDPSKGEERVAELRRIVGRRRREGLPVPGRWRGE